MGGLGAGFSCSQRTKSDSIRSGCSPLRPLHTLGFVVCRRTTAVEHHVESPSDSCNQIHTVSAHTCALHLYARSHCVRKPLSAEKRLAAGPGVRIDAQCCRVLRMQTVINHLNDSLMTCTTDLGAFGADTEKRVKLTGIPVH